MTKEQWKVLNRLRRIAFRFQKHARPVPSFPSGGTVNGPRVALLGNDSRPEHVLTDEQLKGLNGIARYGVDLGAISNSITIMVLMDRNGLIKINENT